MYYAQFGEDQILAGLFAGTSHGTCVEVGANNGVDGSATLHFEEAGWTCVLVEPIPSLCREIQKRRKAKVFECAASSEEGEAVLQVGIGSPLAHAVSALGGKSARHIRKRHGFDTQAITIRTRTLDSILEEAGVAPGIDFISIDVEGHELELLKGFTLDRWRPKILIIEDNGPFWDATISNRIKRDGYRRFLRTGVNDWYAHETSPLASDEAQLAYYPSMVRGRLFVTLERLLGPALPALRRLPGYGKYRDLLLRQTAPPVALD